MVASGDAASWIDLIFHIKGGENGIVEVWANGPLTAQASGWIGYEGIDLPADIQYFKVGPYRDPAGRASPSMSTQRPTRGRMTRRTASISTSGIS